MALGFFRQICTIFGIRKSNTLDMKAKIFYTSMMEFHIFINIELSKFVNKMSHKHTHQKPINVMCDKLLMRGTLYLTLLLIV